MKNKKILPLIIANIVVALLLITACVIYVLTRPNLNNAVDKSYDNVYKSQLSLIKSSAVYYVGEKKINIESKTKITLKELQDAGAVFDMKDAKDKTLSCDGYVIVEKKDKDYIYTPYLKCGDNYKSKNYDLQ